MMSDDAQSLWPQAGYAQLKKDARGHLTVTDDFLRVLLLRPELAPIESSCQHEIQMHERLLENPRLDVQAADLALVQDSDAADNMAVWLRCRCTAHLGESNHPSVGATRVGRRLQAA